MGDETRFWTTVGSTGTLEAADLAKVTLHGALVRLGTDIAPPEASRPDSASSVAFPPATAVVRYNITPVDGLFPPPFPFHYALQLTYRGVVRARLAQFDLNSDGETDLLHFDSDSFAPAHSLATNISFTKDDSQPMDFINRAYYVEAVLSASALTVGNPAEIAVVKVFPSPDFNN